MKTFVSSHAGGVTWCATATHWRANGTHRDGGAGHQWVDFTFPPGVRLTFDETQPNGAAIMAACIDNDMVEVT